jgi:RimJ/RimL family protein N-acetyltransferase
MNASTTLSNGRVCLRRWRGADRDAFAAMNADSRVMQFFPNCLRRDESDAMIDRIEEHFGHRGFGLWAVEVSGVAPFVGFTGLSVLATPPFGARGAACVEIGWRLAFEYWGHGYATEAGRLALGHAFGALALAEVVSFTSVLNFRSRGVMERLGMLRDPVDDFDHPRLPEGHPLRRHVLYRLDSNSYRAIR